MSSERFKPFLRLGFCAACLSATFVSQSKSPPSEVPKPPVKTLTPYAASLTDVPTFGSFGQTYCDRNGNLYFHLDNGSYNSGVIMRLDRSSWKPHLYKIPPDLAKDRGFLEYSVSSLGNVRSLEQTKNGQYDVLSFDSESDDVDKTHLQIPDHLWLTDFVASDTGTLLVGGYYYQTAPKDLQGQPFLALLEPNGRIQKDFTIEGPGPVNLATVNKKHHDGVGAVGPDGNFYFVSGSALMVFSVNGDLVRRIPLPKPDDSTLYASSVRFAGDLVSIEFSKPDEEGMLHRSFLVLSASTGEPHALYVPSDDLGNNCVCFDARSGYTFLRVENGKLKFVTALLN